MLKKIIFYDGSHITINKSFLYADMEFLEESYKNGRLKGANVFARLFNIIDDNLFANKEKNEFDLSNFEIYSSDWVLLVSFLRNGYLPASYDIEKNILDLNYCYNTTIKLGGIPEFETYYETCTTFDPSCQIYNPMKPSEDTKNVYSWRVVSIISRLRYNESVTVNVNEHSSLLYARKLINETEEDNDTEEDNNLI